MEDEQAAKIVKEELSKSNTTPLLNPSDGAGFTTSPAPSTEGLIKQAMDVARDLKEQLDRKETLLRQEQELEARRILGGKSEAGIKTPEKSKEEIAREEAKKFLEGTGLKIF